MTRTSSLALVLAVLCSPAFSCRSAAVESDEPAHVAADPPDAAVAASSQALCPTGPAFPSCFGSCGHLDCSPLDPGVCCACDAGCLARGDCCCDFLEHCPAPPSLCVPNPDASCDGRCGARAPAGCWCDTSCSGFGDCCADYVAECRAPDPARSCVGRCGGSAPGGCWCDTSCSGFGDCCADHAATCLCAGAVPLAEADERVEAIAVGPGGEVYVAGSRARPADFASDRVDGFLRRIHPTTFATVWDRPIDNCFWDSINDVAVLPGGDVVVVGATRPGTFASTPAQLLVRRYSPSGHMMWQATPTTALGSVVAHAVAADPTNGTIVITGAVSSPIVPLFARLDGLGSVRRLTTLGAGGAASSVGRGVAVACGGAVAIITRDSGDVARVIALNADASVRWIATEPAGSEGVDVAFASSDAIYAASAVRGTGTHLGSLARYTSTGTLQFRHTIDLTTRHSNPIGGLAVRGADAVVAGSVVTAVGTREPYLRIVSPAGAVLATRMFPGISVSNVTDVALDSSVALIAAQQSTGTRARTLVLAHGL